MRRRIAASVGLVVLAFAAACDSRPTANLPTAPSARSSSVAPTPGTCTTLSELKSLATTVFGAGSPNLNSALGKLDNLQHQLDIGDYVAAKAKAIDLATFVLAKFRDPTHPLPGSNASLVSFINKVFCYAGLSFTIADPSDTWVITTNDTPVTLVTGDGDAGTIIPPGTFTEPTVVTVTTIPDTFTTPGAGPLHTRLDQYSGYVSFTHTSASNAPMTGSVTVEVCPDPNIPADVRARLRLGHDASYGFEITPPPTTPSILTCPTSTASTSRIQRWIQRLASLVTPTPLYAAKMKFSAGGVGGIATEFSPFAPIDGEVDLAYAGGVGGTSSEFQTGGGSSPRKRFATKSSELQSVDCSAGAVVNTQLDPACRPAVVVRTALGTLLQNVPISWAIGLGAGTVAPENAGNCGTFASTASNATGANGVAKVCWTMGATPGTNTVVATPSTGGDVPAGTTFDSRITFTSTGTQITPTATTAGDSVIYDGAAHAGTASCSNGLTPSKSYSPGSGAPVNAGAYTLTVTCGDGGVLYTTVTATARIKIEQAATATAVTCPASATYTGSALTPCSATTTGPNALSVPTAVTYSSNVNAGTATASATYAGGGNYLGSTGSATFVIGAASTTTAVTCPASAAYTGSALTPCSALTTGPNGFSTATTVTYSSNVNVGTAAAGATYAGSANYATSTGTGSFQITPAVTSTAVSCPASATYTGSALTPCSATTTGPGGLSVATTVSYSANVNVGTATASATYAAAGNYQASTGSGSFQVTKASTSTVVTCPASVMYTGSALTPCSATTTGANLSVATAVSYTSNVLAGTATASAAYAGDANHTSSNGSATFQITGATTTSTVTCPATTSFTNATPTVCTGRVTGSPSLNQALTPSYSGNVGLVTVSVSFPGAPNYLPSSGSTTMRVLYVQSSCFASPIYSSLPDTKSPQKKGSMLPLKCSLATASGAPVTSATGDLTVDDLGTTTASPTGPTVLTVTGAFRPSSTGTYSYSLDTSPAAFVIGHYYKVTARWNDTSTTVGFFFIK